MKPCKSFLLCTMLCGVTAFSHAEDRTQPTIDGMIGGLFFSDHSYVADTHIHLPLYYSPQFSFSYDEHEVTPVFKEHAQTQLINMRHDVSGDFSFNEYLRAIGLGGYHHMELEDRPGSLSAYELGAGLGSPVRPETPRIEWSAVVGGYVSQQRLDSDWWADLHFVWRAYEFSEGQMLETKFKPLLGLAADIESSNKGEDFRAFYRIGPVLDVMSANGNRVRFHAQWYRNDGNPFLETSYSAMFLGVEVSSSLDQDKLFSARDTRPIGWLPLVWGQYDVGTGGERNIQRTELNAEIHDFRIADQVFTGVLYYEGRQEYRVGDYDNASYTISFGVQTRVGLQSILSQGQPLVTGLDYLHRSAHALAPNADRVPPGTTLPHSSLNLFPRLRLQTLGWDVPYRDPSIYKDNSRWLNNFDWRLTLAYNFYHSRDRGDIAAQAGLNWDIATARGCVIYSRGLISAGDETPDWLGELGVRRRVGKLFFRAEKYGLEGQLANGETIVVGIGFYL